jgi:YfiH family protein
MPKTLRWITPDWSAPPNVGALTTCRQGSIEDNTLLLTQNSTTLQREAGLPENPRFVKQVHGIDVVDAANISINQSRISADAIYSQEAGIVCGILTADCLPLLLCNKAGTWVAAIHAGWRGLSMGIIDATLSRYPKSTRDDVLVWLGPAIGPSAFEVSHDVMEQFKNQGFNINETVFKSLSAPNKFLANLYALARQRLETLGILRTNITGGTYCTYTQSADFYSYRREGTTGRMVSLIWRA